MSRSQWSFKCMAACKVLPWPECRRPSNTITPAGDLWMWRAFWVLEAFGGLEACLDYGAWDPACTLNLWSLFLGLEALWRKEVARAWRARPRTPLGGPWRPLEASKTPGRPVCGGPVFLSGPWSWNSLAGRALDPQTPPLGSTLEKNQPAPARAWGAGFRVLTL